MKKILKIIGFGISTWAAPFILSCFLYSREGEPLIDIFLIKTIMIVLFSILGVVLLVIYFKGIKKSYFKEGIIIGFVWLAINWALDLAILIPMSDMGIDIYFTRIGLRYLIIPTISMAMGYMVAYKTKTKKISSFKL